MGSSEDTIPRYTIVCPGTVMLSRSLLEEKTGAELFISWASASICSSVENKEKEVMPLVAILVWQQEPDQPLKQNFSYLLRLKKVLY